MAHQCQHGAPLSHHVSFLGPVREGAPTSAQLARLDWASFVSAIDETVSTSAMLLFIFIGALMFGRFVALTKFPELLAQTVAGWHVAPFALIAVVMVIYLVLGCFLDTVAMILITAPVFLPLVQSPGFDAVWFGILVVIVAEMRLIAAGGHEHLRHTGAATRTVAAGHHQRRDAVSGGAPLARRHDLCVSRYRELASLTTLAPKTLRQARELGSRPVARIPLPP